MSKKKIGKTISSVDHRSNSTKSDMNRIMSDGNNDRLYPQSNLPKNVTDTSNSYHVPSFNPSAPSLNMDDISYSESIMCKPTITNSGITQLRFINKLKTYKKDNVELSIVLRGLNEYLDGLNKSYSMNAYALIHIFKDERYTNVKAPLSVRYDEFIEVVSQSKSEGWTIISEYVENLP